MTQAIEEIDDNTFDSSIHSPVDDDSRRYGQAFLPFSQNEYRDTQYQESKSLDVKPIEKQKKQKKKSLEWNSKLYKLIAVSYPLLVPANKNIKRKYRIQLKYKIIDSGKIKKKNIFFGLQGQSDLIDGISCNEAAINVIRLSHKYDFFHQNFWRIIMLNRYQYLSQAFDVFIKENKLEHYQ